jgi:hypothetical protein
MNLPNYIRTMDRRLRLMLISTALLIIPIIGQFVAIGSINKTGHESNLAVFFMFAAIFIVPTSLIFSAAIVAVVRRQWREHLLLLTLATVNLLIIVNVTWFFIDQCSWTQAFGLALRTCH